MNKHSLTSVIRRKKVKQHYGRIHNKYDNIFEQDFTASQPNIKWSTDITYIQTNEGTLYLSVIKDLYDTSIVGYEYSTNPNADLVVSTVRKAINSIEDSKYNIILHSDQGTQYTSYKYSECLMKYDITPSMSRRGNPYDNACVESFFSAMKTEWLRKPYKLSLEEVQKEIDDYIKFYNNERISLKLNTSPNTARKCA